MKKSVRFCAGLFACPSTLVAMFFILSGSLIAHADHYMGGTAAFQSPLLVDRLSITSPRFGYGGMLGGEWLWQKKHFTIETGLQVAYSMANLAVENETLHFNMLDTQGKPFVYQGYMTGRIERFSALDLQIPLLLGLEYNHVYASAGAIAVYTVTGRARQSAFLTTTGDYDRYYETLTDMPNHGFFDRQQVMGQAKLGSGLDVRLHAEIGTAWHTIMMTYSAAGNKRGGARKQSKKIKWHAGLFFDYGFRNLLADTNIFRNGTTAQLMTEADTQQYMSVTLHPVYSSQQANVTRLNNLSFGIRLTVLFPLSSGNWSFRSCHCVYL